MHKLNLTSRGMDEDAKLLNLFYQFLSTSDTLYEQTFFDLFGGIVPERLQRSPQHNQYSIADFQNLKKKLELYQIQDSARSNHAYFSKDQPQTLLYPEIENIWGKIEKADDWSAFQQKISQISAFRGLYKLG